MDEHGTGKKTAGRRRRVTFIVAALAAVLSGIFYFLMKSRAPNMQVVFYLVLGASALLVMYLALWTLGANEKRVRLARVLRRCYLVFMAVGLAFFLTMQGLILSGAHTEDAEVDCLVVLGAGLRNGAPSLILRRRLNAALNYLHEHGGVPVIVSGGLGRGEAITEAEAMFRYLSAREVDEALIWKEDASTSTRENLAFSLALMEEKGLDVGEIRIAVVSNEFHLYRAKLIAGRAGLDAVGIAAETPGFFLRLLYSCREAFALASELVFGGFQRGRV